MGWVGPLRRQGQGRHSRRRADGIHGYGRAWISLGSIPPYFVYKSPQDPNNDAHIPTTTDRPTKQDNHLFLLTLDLTNSRHHKSLPSTINHICHFLRNPRANPFRLRAPCLPLLLKGRMRIRFDFPGLRELAQPWFAEGGKVQDAGRCPVEGEEGIARGGVSVWGRGKGAECR
jgi:hypothetical protein